jgi:hypothetical protein
VQFGGVGEVACPAEARHDGEHFGDGFDAAWWSAG